MIDGAAAHGTWKLDEQQLTLTDADPDLGPSYWQVRFAAGVSEMHVDAGDLWILRLAR